MDKNIVLFKKDKKLIPNNYFSKLFLITMFFIISGSTQKSFSMKKLFTSKDLFEPKDFILNDELSSPQSKDVSNFDDFKPTFEKQKRKSKKNNKSITKYTMQLYKMLDLKPNELNSSECVYGCDKNRNFNFTQFEDGSERLLFINLESGELEEVTCFRFNKSGSLILFEHAEAIHLLNLETNKLTLISDNSKNSRNSINYQESRRNTGYEYNGNNNTNKNTKESLLTLEDFDESSLFINNDKHLCFYYDNLSTGGKRLNPKVKIINIETGKIEFSKKWESSFLQKETDIKKIIKEFEKKHKNCIVM